jgi:peptidoglycan/xylan/chitin deacetylase (PgdA/CDA1 family)
MNTNVTIVMYHYVRDVNITKFPRIKARSIKEFENQILYFKAHYNIISIDQLLLAITDKYELPPNAAMFSFDDGYLDHYINVLPLLMKYKIYGSFYPCGKAIYEGIVMDVNKIHFILASVNDTSILIDEVFHLIDINRKEYKLKSNEYYYNRLGVSSEYDNADVMFIKRLLQRELVVDLRKKLINKLFNKYVTRDEAGFNEELYMNKGHIKEMIACNMHIGSHGYSHEWFDNIGYIEQYQDIQKSINVLSSLGVNTQHITMCYPYGAYNRDTLEILVRHKISLGFIVKNKLADIRFDNPLLIPRYDTNKFPIIT